MSTETGEPFGALLRRYRWEAGLTQEALAGRAGLSVRNIQNLERGANRPLRDTARRLAGALDLAANEQARFLALAPPVPRSGTPLQPAPPALIAISSPPAAPAAPIPLVGRAGTLAALERHLTGGGPPLLLLTGEPGIGKTRLLEEAIHRAVASGLAVLGGACHRGGGAAPYAPLLEALRRHILGRDPPALRVDLAGCAWLARLLPELAELAGSPLPPLPRGADALPPEQQRRLMFGAVGRFLVNVAGPAGTLLVLDDLHWAGADALDLLAALVRAATPLPGVGPSVVRGILPLRLVGAYRDTEVRDGDPLDIALADLAREGLATQHALDPLTPDDARRLLDALLGDVDSAGGDGGDGGAGSVALAAADRGVRAGVLRRAGGVPFFLVSYAQGLRATPDTAGGVTGEAAIPWDLRQGVRQRVAALPPAAREALEAVVVAGRDARRRMLLDVVGRPPGELDDALDEACRVRLLAVAGAGEGAGEDAYRCAHDAIGDVVEAGLGVARRAGLHRGIATALERRTAGGALPVEALAYHYSHGGEAERAVPYLELAGDRARGQGASVAAQGYYREAIDRLDGLVRSLDAAHVRIKLAGVMRTAGRGYDETLALLEQAAGTCRAAGDLEGLGQAAAEIGYLHWARGTIGEGARRLEEARDLIEAHAEGNGGMSPHETGAPVRGLAALYASLAQLYARGALYAAHLSAVERTATLARAVGDDNLLVAAELNRALALLVLGRGTEGAAALEDASRLAEETDNLPALAATLTSVAIICLLTAGPGMGLAYAERAREVAERAGDMTQLTLIHYLRGEARRYRGAWDEARVAFATGRDLAAQTDAPWRACHGLLGLGVLALARDGPDAARRYLDEGLRLARQGGESALGPFLEVTRAECDLRAGRHDEAYARLRPLVDALDQPGAASYALTRLAWACMETGRTDEAADAAAGAIARARAEHTPVTLANGLLAQARLDTRLGRWSAAERALAEALDLARAFPDALGEAQIVEAQGTLHERRGERALARARLEEASARAQQLGAGYEAARLERALASLTD